MPTILNSEGLLSSITHCVAVASMQLPQLGHSYDAQFLRMTTTKAIGIFLQKYLDQCEGSARVQWMKAAQENDFSTLVEWVTTYADFESDPTVAIRAEKAMKDVSAELQKTIQDDYRNFVSKHSA